MTGASGGSTDGGRDDGTVVAVDSEGTEFPREDGEAVDDADQPARDPTSATAADLRRLRDLSHLLDDSIRVPGTDFRIGLEPLIGLLPVVGDAVGMAISTYVFAVAARSGVPRATLGRVAFVLWVDAVGGAVPVLGDLFDAYWKANLRVADLLDARLDDPASAAADWRYLRRLAVVAVVFTLVAVALLAALVWWLLGYLGAV